MGNTGSEHRTQWDFFRDPISRGTWASSVRSRIGLCLSTGFLIGLGSLISLSLWAEDPPGQAAIEPAPLEISLTDKWSVLFKTARARPGVIPFPEKSPLQSVAEFTFTGPMPGHPFGLGEFHADGKWALSQGVVTVVEEKNAVLRLTAADQFEMEGIIAQEGTGGWFLLFGWSPGHGYSLSNFVLRDSPSPWFLTEYRDGKAIPESNQEIKSFEWRGDQPLRMSVVNQQLNVLVGKIAIATELPLENYTAGEIYLGTYDTRYGARKVAMKSLRVRDPSFTKERKGNVNKDPEEKLPAK